MSEEQAKYNTNTGDPELYRRLSVPFATEAEKAARVEDFYGIVRAAREQLGLPDVHLMVRTNYIDGEGVEQYALAEAHFGSSEAALNMLGYGYMSAIKQHLEFLEYVQAVGEKTAVAGAAQATNEASKAMSSCNDAMAGQGESELCQWSAETSDNGLFHTSCRALVEVRIDDGEITLPRICPFCKKPVRAGLKTAVCV